jgi:DNA-binding NarL/FixJ family response regulator
MPKNTPSKKRPSAPPGGPKPAVAKPAEPKPAEKPAARKRVFLVDDHPIVRERLAELIALETDLEVCGEAEDALGALKSIQALRPDIAIVDITLKDTYGIELIKDLKDRCPDVPVLVLSMHEESLFGERAIRAGAKGYLNKQEATKKVISAIRTVLSGGMFVSEQMTATILQRMSGGQRVGGGVPTDVLTDRELEVFQLLGQGLGVRQIAENLFVSVKTVEAHREHIKQKMSFTSSRDLLRYAIQYTLKEGQAPKPTEGKA